MTEKNKINEYEYKAEMNQLLELIIHSLYTHPEVFLRELISNASDALNKVRYQLLTDKNILDAEKELEIKIEINEKDNTFSISDNGIGMTKDELINNVGTIAKSGTLEFIEKIKKSTDSSKEQLIGQFGVGFYSVFMVTEEVTLDTRHANSDSQAFRWKSKADGKFTVEEIEKNDRGTKISFKLKEDYKDFSTKYKIKETINKYSNFSDFPIILDNEKLNTVEALWRKNSSELKEDELKEFYKFISKDYTDPLSHLHVSVESTDVNFKALIFIPQEAPFDFFRSADHQSLNLYCNKILIQENCKELLPEYLKFLRGVVDTSDLPLNVSRETVQSSPVMTKISSQLTTKILAWLKNLANKETDKFEKFYKNFGPLLKTGLHSDFKNRDKIIELLRFVSSTTDRNKLTSLKEYVSRIKPDQNEIYYVSGDSIEMIERNPNLEYFKKKEIEVLYLTDPVDVFVIPSIGEYEKKAIKSIDKSDINLMPEDKIETTDNQLTKDVINLFKEHLKDKISDVVSSKRLVNSAVTLVSDKDSMDPQMEKMMKMLNQSGAMLPNKKIFEINTEHELIKNISKLYIEDKNNPLIVKCIDQLYEGALFIDGNLPTSSDFITRMTEIMTKATK